MSARCCPRRLLAAPRLAHLTSPALACACACPDAHDYRHNNVFLQASKVLHEVRDARKTSVMYSEHKSARDDRATTASFTRSPTASFKTRARMPSVAEMLQHDGGADFGLVVKQAQRQAAAQAADALAA